MRIEVESDAWADGQVRSKLWLCEQLEKHLRVKPPRGHHVWLLGGWYAMTAFLLFSRDIARGIRVQSFDVDPDCAPIARKVNNLWEIEGRFQASTADVNGSDFSFSGWGGPPDVVINTSCEHMEPSWYLKVPSHTLLALQGTNMEHEQHEHGIASLDEMRARFPMRETLFAGTLSFSYPDKQFDRFMLIGRRA